MSLAIETDTVTHVLLADGWHTVHDKSFDIDSFEFLHNGDLIHGGGNSGICAAGFSFIGNDGRRVYGPLTSILAVSSVPPGNPTQKTKPDDGSRTERIAAEIIECIESNGTVASASDLAKIIGRKKSDVLSALNSLIANGEVTRNNYGGIERPGNPAPDAFDDEAQLAAMRRDINSKAGAPF